MFSMNPEELFKQCQKLEADIQHDESLLAGINEVLAEIKLEIQRIERNASISAASCDCLKNERLWSAYVSEVALDQGIESLESKLAQQLKIRDIAIAGLESDKREYRLYFEAYKAALSSNHSQPE